MSEMETTGVKLVAQNASEFLSDLNRADKGIKDFVDGADKGGPKFSAFGEIVTGALREIGAIAVDALGQAAQAAVGFFQDSVSQAADFEGALQNFASVAGDALGDAGYSMEDVSNKALELGQNTAFAADEALQALTELVKGGVPVEEAMGGATDATLNLAAAGELELGKAAEIVAKGLGVWASTGVEAADVADLMAQAANASTVDVEELALGLYNAQGAAKGIGASFEDLVTSLAVTSGSFSCAADAGTSMKVFLTRLVPSTKPAISAMKELGIITEDGKNRFFDAQGAYVGTAEAAGILQDAFKDLTAEAKVSLMHDIFGDDASRTAQALADLGEEGFGAVSEAMAKAGTAAEQAAERNKGFAKAVDAMQGSLDTLKIIIGTALLPVLTDFVQNGITPIINALGEWAMGITQAEDPLAALGAALNEMLPGFSEFAQAIADFALNKLLPDIQSLADTLSSVLAPAFDYLVANAFPALTSAIEFVSQHWEGFKGALIGLAALIVGPLAVGAIGVLTAALGAISLPIVAAVAAVAALGFAWGENFMGIRDATTSVLNYLQELLGPVLAAFQQFGSGAIAEIMAFVTTGQSEFTNFNALLTALQSAITTLFTDLVAYLQEQLPVWIATLQQWGQAAWQWAQEAIPQAIAQIQEWGGQLLSYIQGQLPGWIATLAEWGQAAWDWLAEVIPVVMEKIAEWGTSLLNYISTNLPTWVNKLAEWAREAWEWLADAMPTVIAKITEWGTKLLSYITDNLPTWISNLAEWAQEAWEWLADAMPPLLEKLAEFLDNLISWATEEVLPGIVEFAAEWAEEAYIWITEQAIPGMLQGLSDFLSEMLSKFGEIAEDAADAAEDIGDAIIDGLASVISNAVDYIAGLVADVISGAIAAAKSALQSKSPSKVFMELGESAMEGLAIGITSGADMAIDATRDAVGEMTAIASSALSSMWSGGIVSDGTIRQMVQEASGAAVEVLDWVTASSKMQSNYASDQQAAAMREYYRRLGGIANAQQIANNSVTNYNNSTQFVLNATTSQQSQGIIRDFSLMQAMAAGNG